MTPRALLWLCAVCFSWAACSAEPTVETQATVLIESDLLLAEQLAFVEVQLLGREAPQPLWLRVTDTCAAQSDGARVVGSFSLVKGLSSTQRLRVQGYGPVRGQGAPLLLSQSVDVPFQDGKARLVKVALARACVQVLGCGSEQTCDASTAGCAPVPTAAPMAPSPVEDCLRTLAEAPVLAATPDAGLLPDPKQPPAQCQDDDGECPAPCTRDIDNDCRKEQGSQCLDHGDCKNSLCVHGYCCDRTCEGSCERCDLDGLQGTCSAIDYSASSDVRNCGGCGMACSSANIAESCVAGSCGGECDLNFADCNQDKRSDGCETNLTEPDNCGACGHGCSLSNASTSQCIEQKCVPSCLPGFRDCNAEQAQSDGCEQDISNDSQHCGACNMVCDYPYCYGGKCGARRGTDGMQSLVELPAGTFFVQRVRLSTGTLLGLGVRLSLLNQASSRVRLALYDELNGVPYRVVAQTPPLDALHADAADASKRPLTEAAVTPAPVAHGATPYYWFVIVAEAPVGVWANNDLTLTYYQENVGFPMYPSPIGPMTTREQPTFNAQVFVAPQ